MSYLPFLSPAPVRRGAPPALFVALVLGMVAAGCGSDGPSGPAGSLDGGALGEGEALDREPLEEGNSFACATCHALSEPAADALRRPGHPIGNATRRSSYKNGQLTDMREAVNTCLTEWMNASAWSEGDPRWSALFDFLDEQATMDEAPDVTIEVVSPPSDLTGGDPERGRATFNGSCTVCHGENASGTTRAPALGGAPLDREYIARRVRTSGRQESPTYDGLTGGIMPFWAADRLSDDELLDVVAYLHDKSMSEMPDGGMVGSPDGGTGGGRDCEATHPDVGKTAELITRFHDVSGTARMVDDCTIVIENFVYDGTGIDVPVYAASAEAAAAGRYQDGFPISDDLRRSGGYNGETLTLTVPEGRTLDDIGGISVWCVDVGISFGDGLFE
jgi:mono/diheme cytochrome c family protein